MTSSELFTTELCVCLWALPPDISTFAALPATLATFGGSGPMREALLLRPGLLNISPHIAISKYA